MKYSKKSKHNNKYKIGYKFGLRTLISSSAYKDDKGRAHFYVKCICGKKKFVDCNNLIKGIARACEECGNSRKGELNPGWCGIGEIPGKYFKQLGLRKRNKQFKKYLWKLYLKQERKCNLTGLPISFDNHTASLDRINSNIGYVKGNLQWVHKDINIMKNWYPEDYFVNMCYKIVEHNTCRKI